jgi:hypothetical protein
MSLPGIAGIMAGLAVAAAGGGLTPTAATVGLDTVSVNTVHGYTATGLTVGDPVFVFINAERDSGASARTISSVTIGGAAATQIFNKTGQPSASGLYFIASAGSTSLAVSVTFSANVEEVVLGHFQIPGTTQTTYSASTAAAMTTTAGSFHDSTAIAIPSGGVLVAMCVSEAQPASAATWTDDGADAGTEMLDMPVATGSNVNRISLYWTNEASVTTARASYGASTTRHIGAFTWGP